MPYVIVEHKSTGRKFLLDRGYGLLPTLELPTKYRILQTDNEWAPSFDSQRPEWAAGLPSKEFRAIWIDCQIDSNPV